MKAARLVSSFVPLMFAARLVLVLATAQSNPDVRITQANATRGAQTLPGRGEAQPVAAAQAPRLRFAKVATYNTGLSGGGLTGANPVAIADVNGDGKTDLVVVEGDSMFSVLLGNGDGTFQAPVSYSSGGPSAYSVAIADLNGDGKLDVVFAGDVTGREVVVGVLLGNGDGTFQTPVIYSTGTGGYDSVAIADLNGDGYADVVVASECLDCAHGANPGGVSVLLGNGDGTFQAPTNYGSGGWDASSVAIADLNGDGYPDLAVSNLCELSANCPTDGAPPGEVSVLLGNGDGTFQTPVSYSSGGSWATSVGIGALSGGGYPDLVATNLFVPEDAFALGVLLGNGNGTFQAPVPYAETSPFANFVAIADVNGDGYLDLVVANTCELNNRKCGHPGYHGGVAVLLGNGDGTFQGPINYSSGGPDAMSVAVADVNGDGRPDLLVLNLGSSTVGVLLNQTSYSTKTVLTSSPNPSLVNQTVTFTATITSTPVVPNGEVVTFHNGPTDLGAGTTTNGVATLVTSFAKAKTYTIKATYSGDPFRKASFGRVKQTVAPNSK
jgi:FG-GAP-like repeat/Bacterial Ig-like domain (group 3)